MKGKIRRLAALLAMMLCLSGCTFGPEVDSLLRAPRGSGETGAVQKALSTSLGESVQLKFPTNGESLSPFLFGDWDGDGRRDAAVLFTAEKIGANVNLATLAQNEDGQWRVTAICEGLAAEVDSVTVAALQNSAASQILVGYGTPQTGLYLAVYLMEGTELQVVLQQSYSRYMLADMSDSGSQDLIVVLPENESGNLELSLLTNTKDGFHLTQQVTVGGGSYTGCAALTAGKAGRQPTLVVDGYTGPGSSYLTSIILTYNRETGRLAYYQTPGGEIVSEVSLRYSTLLTSRDLDGNGTVDIPTEVSWNIDPELEHRATALVWRDYTQQEGNALFGVWDMENNFFLSLPEELRETAALRKTIEGWEVYAPETEESYLLVRVASASSSGEYVRLANLGNQQIQARIVTPVEGLDWISLRSGITVL